MIDDTAARGRFAPGSRIDIARVGVGVAVRAGQPKPDISSHAALKQTLVKAKSVTFLPESGNGAHILKVFERLGISEAMKAKTIPQTAPLQVAQAVARGEAELGLFVTNLLVVPGVELVGSFPDELQLYLVFAAAVGAEAKEAQGARALVEYLRNPRRRCGDQDKRNGASLSIVGMSYSNLQLSAALTCPVRVIRDWDEASSSSRHVGYVLALSLSPYDPSPRATFDWLNLYFIVAVFGRLRHRFREQP